MRRSAVLVALVASMWAVMLPLVTGCEGALSPRQTPERAVIHFLKDAGRGDLAALADRVTSESVDQTESWIRQLYFPEVSDPATEEEGQEIDRFIALFYHVTLMEETETGVRVHVIFSATDAILQFPAVAEDPLLPNVARFMVGLVRVPEEESSVESPGEWKIASFEPVRGPT